MSSIPLPNDGGIILKWGTTGGQAKLREFHLERTNGQSAIVYKTHKLLSKVSDAKVPLAGNFFVKRVRPATDQESLGVVAHAKCHTIYDSLVAKRCFDIDLFDPDSPPALGPKKLRSITVFATPDPSLGDLWSYLSGLMIEQGVFVPSAEDPDVFSVAKVIKLPEKKKIVDEKLIPVDPKNSEESEQIRKESRLKPKLSSVDADILLNSLPLPSSTEFITLDLADDTEE
jgi:hypothetical protein